MLTHLTRTLSVLPLETDDDLAAMTRCCACGQAVGLVTLTVRHFVHLGEDVQGVVCSPAGSITRG